MEFRQRFFNCQLHQSWDRLSHNQRNLSPDLHLLRNLSHFGAQSLQVSAEALHLVDRGLHLESVEGRDLGAQLVHLGAQGLHIGGAHERRGRRGQGVLMLVQIECRRPRLRSWITRFPRIPKTGSESPNLKVCLSSL